MAWRATMQQEMDAIERNWMWELVDLCASHRTITLKWVFKLKKDEARAVIKHKVRPVASGFVQQEGVDLDDTSVPVAWMESTHVLGLVAQEGWRVHHMDVKSAFLNGDLKEVYVCQSPGFVIPGKNKVLRLHKALYGLRQAQAWNSKLDSTLSRSSRGSYATSRAPLTMACTTQGAPTRRTSLGKTTVATPAIWTQARA